MLGYLSWIGDQEKRGTIMNDFALTAIGISIIFAATTLGSAVVFLFAKRNISPIWNQIFTGFAAGVMLSASVFGLLGPALDYEVSYMPVYLVAGLGVILGALFLWGIDRLLPHIHPKNQTEEGLPVAMSRTKKMFLAVTIHNVPEGLSVGVVFAVALASGGLSSAPGMMMSALMLSIGIAIQNIPEGALVALPVKAETGSSVKGFLFGMGSGAVEPIAALLGFRVIAKLRDRRSDALGFVFRRRMHALCHRGGDDPRIQKRVPFPLWGVVLHFGIRRDDVFICRFGLKKKGKRFSSHRHIIAEPESGTCLRSSAG